MDEGDFTSMMRHHLGEDIRRTREELDLASVREAAEGLRPGHKCVADHISWGGGASNLHLPVTFDDGVQWMARVRIDLDYLPERSFMKLNLESEIATLIALQAKCRLTPRVYPVQSESELGAAEHPLFFFEDRLGGWPRKMEVQDIASSSRPPLPDEAVLMDTVLDSLTEWYTELATLSCDTVGSLYRDDCGGLSVGPECTPQPSCGVDDRPCFLGPFANAKQRYFTFLDEVLDAIRADRYHHNPSYTLRTYLLLLDARELVEGCKEMEEGPWYVKHGEPKGDEFIMTDDWTITGVVDWEWARLAGAAEVFQAPSFLRAKTYHARGLNAPSRYEIQLASRLTDRGHPALAECITCHSRKYQRLEDLMRHAVRDIKSVNATRRAFLGLPDEAAVDQPLTIEQWEAEAAQRFATDMHLQRLQQMKALWDQGEHDRQAFIDEND